MSFLAIDLGTSFIKGAVLDLDALRLTHVRRVPFPAALPDLPPFYCEVAPDALVAAVRDLIDTLLPHAPGCAGIVMATQMHSLVLVSAQGTPHSNIITWQDQRAILRRQWKRRARPTCRSIWPSSLVVWARRVASPISTKGT